MTMGDPICLSDPISVYIYDFLVSILLLLLEQFVQTVHVALIHRWSCWTFTSNAHRRALQELTLLLMFLDKVSAAGGASQVSEKATAHPPQGKETLKYSFGD